METKYKPLQWIYKVHNDNYNIHAAIDKMTEIAGITQ